MGKWVFPFDRSTITSRYGDDSPPRTSPHRGTDFATGGNDVITAVTNGRITDIYWTNCLGWVCEQRSASGKYRVSYCHLNCAQHGANCSGPDRHKDGSNCMKNLKVNDPVKAGETVVGRIGNTGSCSRGDHLHLVLGKTHRSAVRGYTKDAEAYIAKQLKLNAEPVTTETPSEATEGPQTDVDCEPVATTPESDQSIPARILEAVRTILLWLKK